MFDGGQSLEQLCPQTTFDAGFTVTMFAFLCALFYYFTHHSREVSLRPRPHPSEEPLRYDSDTPG